MVLPKALPGEGRYHVFLSGPSVSQHFGPYHDQMNDFHLGIGAEAYYMKKHWLLGCSGHFMFNDSKDRTAYWIGIAPGYFVGSQKKLWGSLVVIAGGLKKAEYNGGRFSFFGLPFLTVGYNRVALSIAFIPRIANVSYPVLLFQIKVLVYPFQHL